MYVLHKFMVNWSSFLRLLFKYVLVFWECFCKQLDFVIKFVFIPLKEDFFCWISLHSLACDSSQILAHAFMHFQNRLQLLLFDWINNSGCSCDDGRGSFAKQKYAYFSKVASFWKVSNSGFIICANYFANTGVDKIHLCGYFISVNNVVIDDADLRLQAKADFLYERWSCQLEEINVLDELAILDKGKLVFQAFRQVFYELMVELKLFEVNS